jgi:hypothetical protein
MSKDNVLEFNIWTSSTEQSLFVWLMAGTGLLVADFVWLMGYWFVGG